MYSNQNIRKKHTANKISKMAVSTSLVMFPLRIETRFMFRKVEDTSEPDKALRAFIALETFLQEAEKYCKSPENLLEPARLLLDEIERLDAIYKEDRARLRDLLQLMHDRIIVNSGHAKEKLDDLWQRIMKTLPRLVCVEELSANKATQFLNTFEHVVRRLHNMVKNPNYMGHKRNYKVNKYSYVVQFKNARKNIEECNNFFNTIYYNGKNMLDYLDTISHFSGEQQKKFVRLLKGLKMDFTPLRTMYKVDDNRIKDKKRLILIGRGYYKALNVFEKHLYDIRSERKALNIKSTQMVRHYQRYTLLTERLLTFRIMRINYPEDRPDDGLVKSWRKIAENTVFNFHEEFQWLRDLVISYNGQVEDNPDLQLQICLLKSNLRTLKKKKMCYKVLKKCLCVRIYPDEIAVTQMMTKLTQSEFDDAQGFWNQWYKLESSDTDTRHALWQSLCDKYQPYRAAWIIRQAYGAKSINQCGGPINDEEANRFTVPYTRLLPDRFVLEASLKKGPTSERDVVRYGHLIPYELQVGLDLNELANLSQNSIEENSVASSDAKLKGAMRWLTDYDEAERMGMAITMPLEAFKYMRRKAFDKKQYQRKREFEFNSIYVMGIKLLDDDYRKNSHQSQQVIRDLFNAHLYSEEGFDLLNMGTPTNIMGDESENHQMGGKYDTSNQNLVDVYYNQTLSLLEAQDLPECYGDARMLSNLFKMRVDSKFGRRNINNPFINTVNRNNHEINKAQLVNRAFIGLMAKKEGSTIAKLILDNDVLRTFFMYSVLSSGTYPAVRIGSQPYGILPVCDFREMKYWSGSTLHVLHDILVYLTKYWNNIVRDSVLSEENISEGNSQENFLKVINSTPYSSTFYSRTTVNQNMLFSPYYFRGMQRNEKPFINLFNVVKKATGNNGLFKQLQRQLFQEYENIPFKDNKAVRRLRDNPFKDIAHTVLRFVNKRRRGMCQNEDEVKLLISETFDLFNYRLDAWMQGLLHYKLSKRMRRTRNHHIAIGAFGWVFNLKDQERKTKLNEYMLAPSVNQALTAAVLRSSFKRSQSDDRESGNNYDLSINLSSARVRQALRIIKGVQNGLSLGAILGNDLERLLHEDYKLRGGKEMDVFIFYLRQRYPLNADAQDSGKEAQPSDIRVLNGVALLNDLRDCLLGNLDDDGNIIKNEDNKRDTLSILRNHQPNNWDKWLRLLAGPNWSRLFEADKCERLFVLVQELEDAYDALADVVNSESVYKLCEGNRVAVEALMNCVQNERNIPLPDVVNIPLNSAHVEQRMLLAIDTSIKPSVNSTSPLQRAEPALDHWMGEMMGHNQLQLSFTLFEKNYSVKAYELGMSPSDIVYLSDDKERFNRFLALKYWMQQQPIWQPAIEIPTITNNESLSFEEVELTVDNLREMLSTARMLRIDDFIVNSAESPEDAYDLNDLKTRHDVLKNHIESLVKRIDGLSNGEKVTTKTASWDKDKVMEGISILIEVFNLGLFNALDTVTDNLLKFAEDSNANVTIQLVQEQVAFAQALASHSGQLMARLEASDQLLNNIKEKERPKYSDIPNVEANQQKTNEKKIDIESLTQSAKKLLMKSFIMAPHFNAETKLSANDTYTNTTTPLVNLESLEQQKQQGAFSNATPLSMESWLMDVSRIRRPLQLLHQIRMFAKCNALEADVTLTPMQLPVEQSEAQWIGMQVTNENHIYDANSFVVMNASHLPSRNGDTFNLIAGVVFDFWVERIPYKAQTAALTFGYDQPDAEPPQSILVGVSTRGGKHRWSEQHVLGTLKAAIRMTKSRAVSPEDVYNNRWTSCIFPLMNYPTQE